MLLNWDLAQSVKLLDVWGGREKLDEHFWDIAERRAKRPRENTILNGGEGERDKQGR